MTQVTAQRTLAGADSLSGRGRDPDPTPYNEYQPRPKHKPNPNPGWLVRNDKTLNRVEGLLSAASFVNDVYLNAEENYITIDVFASKANPEERRFQVRTFNWDYKSNSFQHMEPYSNADDIRKLLGEK